MNNFYDLILIIDDNRVSNFFNKSIIEQSGITNRVVAIDDGETAYNFIEPKKSFSKFPNVVFLDLYMPDMNGWEFLDKFSEHEDANKSIFIIMCNQDLLPEERMKLNQYSFVKAFTDKNLTLDFINNLVEESSFSLTMDNMALKYS